MKSAIHPQYYDNAKVRCACGNTWTTGSTRPEISLEICNQCHPFYTGREKVLDTRGRIEKFKKRAAKAKTPKKLKSK
ncbi:MAG: 50S ribosomal protein L31 [Patescibacteria group bacterium]